MSMDYLSFIKLLAENALRNFTYNYNIISEMKKRLCLNLYVIISALVTHKIAVCAMFFCHIKAK